MTQTIEQRVTELEKQVSELDSRLSGAKARRKDWERSYGLFKDDPDYESAMQSGREWREAQTWEKEVAGS